MSATRVSSAEREAASLTAIGVPTAPIVFLLSDSDSDFLEENLPLLFLFRFLCPSNSQPIVVRSLLKRFACDFSARASVSNQSATSAKPSSRAAFVNLGYICVYS